MTKGRLNRETNPFNGNIAEVVPHQYDTTGDGDFENITPNNPLPVEVKGGVVGGAQQNQYIVAQEFVNLEDPVDKYNDRYSTRKPCYLQYLVFRGEYEHTQCQLRIYELGDNTPHVEIDGKSMTFRGLQDMGGDNGIFEIKKFDETGEDYVIVLKHPIYCPSGFYVRANGRNSTAQLSAVFFNEVETK